MVLGALKIKSGEVIEPGDIETKKPKLKIVKSEAEKTESLEIIDREIIEAMKESINKYLDSLEPGQLKGNYQDKLQTEYDYYAMGIEELRTEVKNLFGDVIRLAINLKAENKKIIEGDVEKLVFDSQKIRRSDGIKPELIFSINYLKDILSKMDEKK